MEAAAKENIMFRLPFILIMALGIILASCENNQGSKLDTDVVTNSKSASEDKKPYEMPKLTFEKMEHDFGKIIQGEMVKYSFRFTNTGYADLLISKVSTSCGCTVGNFPKNPIPPGESGLIEVIFDSRGRKGFQNKTITVLSNTSPNKTMLRIKSNVTLPENS
jgi:hypothetical protein